MIREKVIIRPYLLVFVYTHADVRAMLSVVEQEGEAPGGLAHHGQALCGVAVLSTGGWTRFWMRPPAMLASPRALPTSPHLSLEMSHRQVGILGDHSMGPSGVTCSKTLVSFSMIC